tara:strand:+ start:1638 stop:5051 length:3414 start_codon:yes stop_codon:yes gene_type:complete
MALLTNINGKFSVSDAGAVTFNNAFTFPTADGAANYVLQTNGSGQLAWALNGNGDISGSGTANTVTKFTGAKVIGDGPITFSGNNSTFAGNVGIGVTPEAWTVFKTSQIGQASAFVGRISSNQTDVATNFYYDGAEKRITTGYAQRYTQTSDGKHQFWTAGTNSADSAITFSKKFEILNNGNATFAATVTAPTFSGDLNGTINTVTTAITKGNSTNDTTVATTAFVQNVIGTIPAGLVFQGTWNASTNSPTLTSGSGTTGNFYIVSVAGTTNLDGITDWQVGDWAVFIEQGASDQWEKIDNSSVLSGSGTGGSFAGWSGSGTSVTLGNAPVTFSGNNSTFAGIVTANGFRTTSGSTDYSLLTRNSSNTAVYIQQAGSGNILDVRYGSQAAGQGTSAFAVNSSGNSTFTGNVSFGGALNGTTGNFTGNVAINGTIIGSDQTFGNPYRTFAFGSNANGSNRIFAATDTSDGIYINAATGKGVNFRVNGGGSNVVIINSSGKVGIGETAPDFLVDAKKGYSSGDGKVAKFRAGNDATFVQFDTVQVVQSDVPCLAIIETSTGTQSDEQKLTFSTGDTRAIIGTSTTVTDGMSFYVNRAVTAHGYAVTGTKALHLQNNGNATFAGDVTVQGGDILNASGHFTVTSADDFNVDAAGQINLDADGGNIRFKDGGTHIGTFKNNSGNFVIKSEGSDDDIIFKGNDGGSEITALTLDMSNGGSATFRDDIDFGGKITQTGSGANTFTGDVQATGIYVGATNTSFDFYNQGTSYFNGTVTVDAAFTQSGGDASTFSGTVETTTLRTDVVNNKANSANIIYRSGTSTLVGGGTTANKLYVLDNGNVGIGTEGTNIVVTGKGLGIQNIGQDTTASMRLTGHNATGNPGVATYTELKHYGEHLRFGINHNGGTDVITINSSKNVGIGTASPAQKLHVIGNIYSVNSGTDGGQIRLANSGGGSNWYWAARTTGLNLGELGAADGRMFIANGGNVGIGVTNPTYKLHVANSNNISIFEDTSNASGAAFIVFNRPSVFSMGSITRNGSANSVSYNTGSDYRLKEDLKDFNALDLVNDITAYDYKWKNTEQRDYGFVAHELKEVLPNVVVGEKDGEIMQGVDYSKLTPVLLKALQEQQEIINDLKSRIEQLEN